MTVTDKQTEPRREVTIKIDGREYPLSLEFTNRDLHTIKQIAGVRPAEIQDAMASGDVDVFVALAVCALRKAGATRPTLEELWDMPVDAIELVSPDDEQDPTPAAASPDTQPTGASGSQATSQPERGGRSSAGSSA